MFLDHRIHHKLSLDSFLHFLPSISLKNNFLFHHWNFLRKTLSLKNNSFFPFQNFSFLHFVPTISLYFLNNNHQKFLFQNFHLLSKKILFLFHLQNLLFPKKICPQIVCFLDFLFQQSFLFFLQKTCSPLLFRSFWYLNRRSIFVKTKEKGKKKQKEKNRHNNRVEERDSEEIYLQRVSFLDFLCNKIFFFFFRKGFYFFCFETLGS